MSVMQPTAVPAAPLPGASNARVPMVGVLRTFLLGEAALGLLVAIVLSMVAGQTGGASEDTIRFVAGGAFLFAIGAAAASRGARRRRGWAWTLAALLQLVLAIGTGIAILVVPWHPAYLAGFALAAVVMIVLSTASVRRALGQE
jgi:peptidoglycan/LPS O-acetylase OafA/YrhL